MLLTGVLATATPEGSPSHLKKDVSSTPKVEQKVEPLPPPAPEIPPPPPVVEPKVAPSYPAGCELYRSKVAQYGWNVSVAMAVMKAESGCNPHSQNMGDYHSFAGCRGSFGLFQINCSHGKVFDPYKNIEIAYAMYQASGWKPWSATTCRYKVKCY